MAAQFGTRRDFFNDLLLGGNAQQVAFFIGQHLGQDVDVRIVKSRQHHLPVEIDDFSIFVDVPGCRLVVADEHDPAALDCHGFRPAALIVDRVHSAVHEHAIGDIDGCRCLGGAFARRDDQDRCKQACSGKYRLHQPPPPPPPPPPPDEPPPPPPDDEPGGETDELMAVLRLPDNLLVVLDRLALFQEPLYHDGW